MIRATVRSAEALQKLKRVKDACAPGMIDPIVERVAYQILADLVRATPKRWFGQLKRDWRILRPQEGVRIIQNPNKVMGFLEFGTANKGTGWIYPRTKKALYIPLTRSAAAGYRPGLVYGRDYVLAKRARGIKPRNIVGPIAKEATERLKAAMKAHLRRVING